MISCSTMFLLLFKVFLFFFFNRQHKTYGFSSSSSLLTDSPVLYGDHCASAVPESPPIFRHHDSDRYELSFGGSYYTGGESILGYAGRFVGFRPSRDIYETIAKGVYKIEGVLSFISRNWYENKTSDQGTVERSENIKFSLSGYWSEDSRKLCMVGSASWQFEEGKFLNVDAVLKLKYANKSSDIFTSLITGTLESINSANDEGYFEPVSIYYFPYLSNYTYSLVSKETGECSKDPDLTKDQSLNLESGDFCSVFYRSSRFSFELAYALECSKSHSCTPFGEYLPKFMFLNVIQCSGDEEKLRYKIEFGNSMYPRDQRFDLNSTLIGEGSWDVKNNRLCLVACRILNRATQWGGDVGDCTTRLTLRSPSIWTLSINSKFVGEIWSSKTVNDSGYHRNIKFRSWEYSVARLQGLKYKYTELDRVKKSCPVKNTAKREGMQYPDGHSYPMRFDFDMSLRYLKTKFAWGNAIPLFVGDEPYEKSSLVITDSKVGTIAEVDKNTDAPMDISYKLRLILYPRVQTDSLFSAYNFTWNSSGELQITAEGLYDPKTGHLCMIGCRVLSPSIQESINNSDCEILVNFDFPSMHSSRGGEIKGSIKSTRKKDDPLYFEELGTSSVPFDIYIAKQSIWRMHLEILMALISNSLACIFVGWQLLHVKRKPRILSYISLSMILILSLGSMIPPVLNSKAMFLINHNEENLPDNTGGWRGANEVTVLTVTMVAFLLQIRLLQLICASRTSDKNDKGIWIREKKAAFVTLLIYILGGLLTSLLNWTRNRYGYQAYKPHALWGDLRSFAGLIPDSFLFPQILLNVFCSSKESSLSHPFYIGMTLVRVLPHGYNLYQDHSYAREYFGGSYYYANPSADFYSTAWDVIIPIVGIALAVIIFLQQRPGGCWILPQRFREFALYQKASVLNNEL